MVHRNQRPVLILIVVALIGAVLAAGFAATPAAANTAPSTALFLLTGDGRIASVTTAAPTLPSAPVAVTGIASGETLVSIDVRPQNGQLYGLGVNATTDTATLYLINPVSSLATPIGTSSGIVFVNESSDPIDLPDPATVGYGIDFNPAADRLRVVAGALNFRVNPNTGGPIDGIIGVGINPDGTINGGTTNVNATAYTNNQPNNSNLTTQYTLDPISNSLFIQNPPNTGTQISPLPVTLNGTPLDFGGNVAMDIAPGINTATSGMAVSSGSALATLQVGATTSLYSINLVSGAATLIGTPGISPLRGLAIYQPARPIIALGSDGTSLVRFDLGASSSVSVTISAIAAGEQLVSIDLRPQTGQLYGLGVNTTANNATLYLIDPQTATPTAVGLAGQIAFADASGSPVDLPDPSTTRYAIDFNPTVDRLRVVTGSGLNFRINPNNGAPIDGNLNNTANPPPNINTDAPLNGLPSGSVGVVGTAYTNNYAQALTGGVTSQYTLDADSDTLFIQTPPNAGTQTAGKPVTLSGAPLNFSAVNGFDIPSGAIVTTSGTVASGFGYAALTVGGTSNLYRIDLATAATTLIGPAPAVFAALVAPVSAPLAVLTTSNTTVSENAGSVVLTILATSGTPLVASYTVGGGTAAAGSDYTAVSGPVLLGNTMLSQQFTLPILDDTIVDGSKTLVVTLNGPEGVAGSLTLTITDNDTPPPNARVHLPLVRR